uniref:Nucleoplasmin-like n=1 Tax=Pogona vitticeps TaxID=103695 RepID=A0ABM5EP46_9SAUR
MSSPFSSPCSSSLSSEEKSVSILWGCELNDRARTFVVEEDDDLLEHLIYLRMVSLGEDADDEPHVVAVESKNMASVPKPVPIASLCQSILPMVSLDGLELIPPVTFLLKSGAGPVYLSGHHLILDEDSDYEPSDEELPSKPADDDMDQTNLEDEEDDATPESEATRSLPWSPGSRFNGRNI